MKHVVPILCVACAAGVAATLWSRLSAGDAAVPLPPGTAPAQASASEHLLAVRVREARRACSVEAFAPVIADLEAASRASSGDPLPFRLLAEAHLERALQRSHLRGMTVGAPVFAELPPELAADLDAGLAAAARARELGDDSGDLFRIEASLMSQRITGLAAALQWNGKIERALQQAAERAAGDPHLHVALGLRKLFAPKLLGHDPAGALERFEYAAGALDDERPAVFAAMAAWLQQRRQQAIEWLERACAKNPANKFARVVLRRLRRGEPDPFGRDVTDTELASAK